MKIGALVSIFSGAVLGFLLSSMGYSVLTWQFYAVFGLTFLWNVSTHID